MDRAEKLAEFERSLESLRFIGEGSRRTDAEYNRTRILGLFRDKFLQELKGSRPLIMVVAGGTNVGKSTIVNGLIGREVTTVSVLARGTKTPVICGTEQTVRWLIENGFLEDVELRRETGPVGVDASEITRSYVISTEDFPPEGSLIIDSPDMDSEYDANRVWAARLMDSADVVLLVVTPEKYHDEVVFRFLERCIVMKRSVAAVFNKASGNDAYDDFISSVWRNVAGRQSVFRVDWVTDRQRDDPYQGIREFLRSIESRRSSIKKTAIKGTVNTLREDTMKLLDVFESEQRWLSDVHSRMGKSLEDVCREYRREIAGEKFEELDRVFGRLLYELKIPILDDFYGGLRSVGRTVWHHVGRLTGLTAGKGAEEQARRSREIDRVLDSSASLRTQLEDILQRIPRDMRKNAHEWIGVLPAPLRRHEVDPFLEKLNARIEEWIRDETEEISRRLEGKPGLKKFIIAMKATLQIGSGVIGAVLTGGLEPADFAVAPAVERMSAYLIERGIGYSYFRRSRVRLLDARTHCLDSFLVNRYLEPLRAVVPEPNEHLVEEIKTQLDEISTIAKDVKYA